MLRSQITREELDRLGEDIKQHIDLFTAELGLEYQQKGFVYNTEVVPGRAITSKVQGAQAYTVTIDLDFFGLSECTCAEEGFCKHMAALFFYVYSAFARPDAFVKEWRQQIAGEPQPAKPGSGLYRKTALLAAAPQDASTLRETSTPEEWFSHIEREMDSFLNRHNRYQYDAEEFYSAAIQAAVRPSQWWGTVPGNLFQLYAFVCALKRIEEDASPHGSWPAQRIDSCRRAAEAILHKAERIISGMDAGKAMERWPNHLRKLGQSAAHALTGKGASSIADWLHLYRLLWGGLIRDEEWIAQEKAALDEALEQAFAGTSGSPEAGGTLALARAHFEMLAGNDAQARQLMAHSDAFHPRVMLSVLRSWEQSGQWERIWEWLQWLLPQCKKPDNELFRALCDMAADAVKQLGIDEEWMRRLQAMLPSSYYIYTEFLLKTGRYREWVDYHLSEQISVSELYPSSLRAVEAHNPSLLFPLYHQAVERSVLQKNRTAYKEAIRQLKKLGALYRQTGQTERFDAYLERLAAHFSRLRAFQEELTKGKLIP